MEKVRVLVKGKIAIPALIRKKYNIVPGCEVQVFEYGNMIYVVPPSPDPVGEAMGCIPQTPSLSEELLIERRKDLSV